MNTNYEYKVSMLEFCSVYGCYYLCWQRNVGFLRFVLIWITKGSISKAMAFYFTENEPLPIPWYGEDVLPIAPKSGFPKRFAFFKKFAFVFLTGSLRFSKKHFRSFCCRRLVSRSMDHSPWFYKLSYYFFEFLLSFHRISREHSKDPNQKFNNEQ